MTEPVRRCTVELPDHSFCDVQAVPDAPFPICLHHAAELFKFVRGLIDDELDAVGAVTNALDLFRKFGVLMGPMHDNDDDRPVREPPEPAYVVYYLRLGDVVKIGFTTNLVKRMKQYPPMAELLATEPGGRETESVRHAQFRHLRAFNWPSEWFKLTPELEQHIKGIAHGDHWP